MTLLELYDLAEKENIEVDNFPMREATAVSFPKGWIAINKNKKMTVAEEKFHLAHELGHCMTGSFYNIYSQYDVKSRHENRANRWAMEKLIPVEKLKKLYVLDTGSRGSLLNILIYLNFLLNKR